MEGILDLFDDSPGDRRYRTGEPVNDCFSYWAARSHHCRYRYRCHYRRGRRCCRRHRGLSPCRTRISSASIVTVVAASSSGS